ncbi:PaaI family thioesterase [Bradyrhizobium sp. WSM 1738]|uniref:PaaI family thioesterase n=1 Tax=Bradyrhizobium hereditatis TaxID=2821405 RepID=UPI001CE2D201|nr:PaaI family thioesterase [Bradyrhizobium hereditatis]MCA6114415.1 PaaI family thioesterase [Bradyrhizobium hereditatis]
MDHPRQPMTPDEIRNLVERVTSAPGYTRAVGTKVESAKAGHVVMSLAKNADLLQANGFFHGGVIAGLADHAGGGAVTTAMPSGRFAVTVNLNVSFLAPAKGQLLIARARAIQVGSTIGVAHVDVASVADGVETPCAVAIVTLRGVDFPAK